MTDNDLSVPSPAKGDAAHAAAKGLISLVPGIGGPAVELFQWFVQPPLDKRRNEWMRKVGEDLQRLESEGLKIDELQSNEQFISAVMHASQVALRSHQDEKIEALRNALRNVALGQSPDETKLHMFLELVGSLTVMHIKILNVFRAPPRTDGLMSGSLSQVLIKAIPELEPHRELYDQLWNQLVSAGLMSTNSLHSMMTANGLTAKRTSALGDEFLDFISEH